MKTVLIFLLYSISTASLAYDDNSIYIGAIMYDSEPGSELILT